MIVALNTESCYSGLGQYSKDINDCFGNVKSLVVDKRYRNIDYFGTKYYMRNIPFVNGWRIFKQFGYLLIKNLEIRKDDVIHYLSPNVPLYHGKKGIVTIHDFYYRHLNNYPKWLINLNEKALAKFKEFDYIITDSQAVATEAIELGFRNPQVVPLPVDELFFQKYDKNSLRRKYGIPEDKIVVLTDGDAEHKGSDIVDRCIRKLGYYHIHIGSKKYDESYSNVPQSILAELYACADVFSRFATTEGFGIPPLQAAVMHLSVVVSDLPVYHETLGNYASFATNEDELLNILAAHKIRDNSTIRYEYSMSKFKERMEKIYQEAESKRL